MNPEKSNSNPQISILQAQISLHSTPNQSINSIYEIQKSIFQFLDHNNVQKRTQKSNINPFFKQIPPLIPLSLSLSLCEFVSGGCCDRCGYGSSGIV